MMNATSEYICEHCLKCLYEKESEYLAEFFIDLCSYYFSGKMIVVEMRGTYTPATVSRLEYLGYLCTTEISQFLVVAAPNSVLLNNGTRLICAKKDKH
jgi:hypothetical protein